MDTPHITGITESPIEDRLLSALYKFDLKPIPQYQIGPYWADFMIKFPR